MSDEFTPHFEHEWQREAWEAERADMRARVARSRRDEVHAADIDVRALLGSVRPTIVPDSPRACPTQRYPGDPARGESCDGEWHLRPSPISGRWEAVGRCPQKRRDEIMATVAAERGRLRGELELLRRLGPTGFDGFDQMHGKGCENAWRAAVEFSQARPPNRNVYLFGTTGLGKSRLLLASHFGLLEGGIRSIYATSPQLREAFERLRSFDDEVKGEAEAFIASVRRAQAVHLDDLGNIEDDERKTGLFREGLKGILDRSSAAWMTGSNLPTIEAAKQHPDVGVKVVSRLMTGAIVVRLEGTDYRIDHAERRR